MKFDKNLAAIHAYLCGDGYVIKNPDTQKHKYYYIGLRNTNAVLLKDFQQKFKAVFNVEPRIVEGRSVNQSKEIYQFLTKDFFLLFLRMVFSSIIDRKYQIMASCLF